MNLSLTEHEMQTVAYYDQYADEWANQRKKPSEPSFWDAEFAIFKSLKAPVGKVLEIGSGAGRESLELVNIGYEYFGIDASKELLKIAQKANPASQLFHASPYDLPFEPETFDAFFSWALLPHIPKDRIAQALDSIHRVLKPDGNGFLAMRQGEGERQEAETGRWFSYYSEKEFETILQNHQFKIVKTGIKPSRANLVWLTFFVYKV